MRRTAFALGIFAGVFGLFFGLLASRWSVSVGYSQTLEALCFVLTLVGMGGAVAVLWRPAMGAAMMAGSMVMATILQGLNFFTGVQVLLFGIAAVLGLAASQPPPAGARAIAPAR